MGNVHQLQSKLKALKLGGMLDTLDLRLGQAQQGHLGYTEFMEMLIEDELQRRANKRLVTRVARARFEEVKTFEAFDFAFNPKIPAQQIRDLATCQFIERKEWALFIGPVGIGKSHTIQALGHQACRMGHKVLYMKTSRLLSDLGGGHADGTWETRLRRYLQPDLLILDDFAMKEFSVQQSEDIYELIDQRSRAGSLVVASNRSPQDWYPLFANPVLAEGILDRLVNRAHHVILTGRSYRPRLRPGHPDGGGSEVQHEPVNGGGNDVK